MSHTPADPIQPDSSAPPPSAHPGHRWAWWRRAVALAVFCLFAVPQVVWRALVVSYFVLAIGFLALRYFVAPQIAEHREAIADAVSASLGLKVEVASLDADWNGLRPRLHLAGVRVFDRQGRPALSLPAVDASLAWTSLLYWRPQLQRIEILNPDLTIHREADGSVFVAGLKVNGGGKDSGFTDFVLGQHEVVVRDARVVWRDQQRGAPELALDKVSMRLLNSGERHDFALRASPPPAMASQIDLRGNLRGHGVTSLADWRGALYLDLGQTDLAVWRQWLDYPLELPAGRGGLTAWLNFEGARVAGLTADFALHDAQVRMAADLPMLDLATASGRLRLTTRNGDLGVAAERLQLATRDGVRVPPMTFAFRSEAARKDRVPRGELSTDRLDLGVLAQLAAYLPLSDAQRSQLLASAPEGQLSGLSYAWQGEPAAPAQFSLTAKLANLTLHPVGTRPGISGLSGTVSGNEHAGRFQLAVRDGNLWAPAFFPAPFLPLTRVDADGSWSRPLVTHGNSPLTVKVASFRLHNEDLTADAAGTWTGMPGEAGRIDLTAHGEGARVAGAWRYVPLHVEGIADWLHQHVRSGRGEKLRLRLAGDLTKFPFEQPGSGEFRVDAQLVDTALEFAHDWPGFTNIQGHLLFERDRMLITASDSRYGAVHARNLRVEVPRLSDAGKQMMHITGQASGPLPDFLAYVHASELDHTLGGFTRGVQAQGNADLDLKLDIPLHEAEKTQVRGGLRFERTQLRLVPGLPLMTDASARINFSEKDFAMPEANASFLGTRVRATGSTDADGSEVFVVDGTLPARGLNELVASPLWASLDGATPARTTIRVRKGGQVDLAVDSQLRGLRSRLPAPFDKPAELAMPMSFGWQLVPAPASGGNEMQNWRLKLDGKLDAQWQDRCAPGCDFLRGAVAIGDTASLPDKGWRLAGRFATLDLDAWRPLLKAPVSKASGAAGVATGNAALAGVSIVADHVVVMGNRFDYVSARAIRQDDRWVLRIAGPQLTGDLRWDGAGQGRIQARLSQLALESASSEHGESQPGTPATAADDTESLPALDVQADQFTLHGLKLGKLTLLATHRNNDWLLDRVALSNPDFTLDGSGVWRQGAGAHSESRFKLQLDAKDAGATLERLGHANALKRGTAQLKGDIAWQGAPTSIDYASMSGALHLSADNGQFAKIETGLGRLLGILSLQALPRRITLDFRDIFSEGFAFDTLRADLTLANGVMSTQNLEIRGPSAKVFMRGSTDVARETHDLHVTVQPALSEMVAVGAVGAINPLAGVATYLAQKVLRDPLEKLFSFDYRITGAWADPKIEKIPGVLVGPETQKPDEKQ